MGELKPNLNLPPYLFELFLKTLETISTISFVKLITSSSSNPNFKLDSFNLYNNSSLLKLDFLKELNSVKLNSLLLKTNFLIFNKLLTVFDNETDVRP